MPGPAASSAASILLRYLVDFNNHPEPAMGALGGDIRNAPPLAIFSDRAQEALQAVVAEHNRSPAAEDAFAIAERIRRDVYGERFHYGIPAASRSSGVIVIR